MIKAVSNVGSPWLVTVVDSNGDYHVYGITTYDSNGDRYECVSCLVVLFY